MCQTFIETHSTSSFLLRRLRLAALHEGDRSIRNLLTPAGTSRTPSRAQHARTGSVQQAGTIRIDEKPRTIATGRPRTPCKKMLVVRPSVLGAPGPSSAVIR